MGTPTTHSNTARAPSWPGSRPVSGHWKSDRCSLPTVAFLPALVLPASPREPGTKPAPLLHAFDKTHPFPVALLCSSASATPEFEGRGGDDLGTEIANTLYRIFNKSSIDLKSLCISPREHCWVLYVDVLVGLTSLHWPRPTSVGDLWTCFPPCAISIFSWILSVSRVRLLGETLVSHNGF